MRLSLVKFAFSPEVGMKFRWMPAYALLLLAACSQSYDEPIPWPTSGWPASSPEEQGMDETRLSALDSSLATEHGYTDCMLCSSPRW